MSLDKYRQQKLPYHMDQKGKPSWPSHVVTGHYMHSMLTGCWCFEAALMQCIFYSQVSCEQQLCTSKPCALSDLHHTLLDGAFGQWLSCADVCREPGTTHLGFPDASTRQNDLKNRPGSSASKSTWEAIRDCWPSWRNCSRFQQGNLPKAVSSSAGQ